MAEFEQTIFKLRAKYDDISATAREVLRERAVEPNPNLLDNDLRYSLYAAGFISGPIDPFLEEVTQQVSALEPSMERMPNGYRHLTICELNFSEVGRRNNLRADMAIQYYKALQAEFTHANQPITLELDRLMLTKDKEQSSLSLVAAFLPKDDVGLNEVRNRVATAVGKAQLPLKARINGLSVALCTLGRFVHPPRFVDASYPIVEEVENLNRNIPQTREAQIHAFVVGTTSPGNYIWAHKHIFLVPPIYLGFTNEITIPLFLRASW